MPRRPHLPDVLRGRVFTAAEAAEAGLSTRQLTGPHVVTARYGQYRYHGDDLPLAAHLGAVLRELPEDAAVSHMTALRMFGVPVVAATPMHFSTSTDTQTRHLDVTLHRRDHRLRRQDVDGFPCLGPERSFVDSATCLSLRELVRAGDALVRLGQSSVDSLISHCIDSHIDGVVLARKAAVLVRDKVDSFRESDLRLIIVLAGLPEPDCNRQILDGTTFLARGDLVLPEYKIVIEYDGWHHERDAHQRQKDIHRRERLEAAGWRVIIVTSADMKHPISVVSRVHHALVTRGYDGPPPFLTALWHQLARGL